MSARDRGAISLAEAREIIRALVAPIAERVEALGTEVDRALTPSADAINLDGLPEGLALIHDDLPPHWTVGDERKWRALCEDVDTEQWVADQAPGVPVSTSV